SFFDFGGRRSPNPGSGLRPAYGCAGLADRQTSSATGRHTATSSSTGASAPSPFWSFDQTSHGSAYLTRWSRLPETPPPARQGPGAGPGLTFFHFRRTRPGAALTDDDEGTPPHGQEAGSDESSGWSSPTA